MKTWLTCWFSKLSLKMTCWLGTFTFSSIFQKEHQLFCVGGIFFINVFFVCWFIFFSWMTFCVLSIDLSFVFIRLFVFVYWFISYFQKTFSMLVHLSLMDDFFVLHISRYWDFILVWICSASTFFVVFQFFNEIEIKFFSEKEKEFSLHLQYVGSKKHRNSKEKPSKWRPTKPIK